MITFSSIKASVRGAEYLRRECHRPYFYRGIIKPEKCEHLPGPVAVRFVSSALKIAFICVALVRYIQEEPGCSG